MDLRIKRPNAKPIILYDKMKETLINEGIFTPESILTDDRRRSVCIYTQDGVKYVMKLGNHSSLGETTKFRLLQNEDNMYKHLLQKLGAGYTKYFPTIIYAGDAGDARDAKDFYYIIMEYIEGITLSDYVNRYLHNPPPANDVLLILLNLTKALEAMYSTGIVHGDLSAENVMIQENLDVKIIDFEKGSTTKKLSLNTIGSTRLKNISTEDNINNEEQEPQGLGYLFLAIKLLSLVPVPKSLILNIMRKIFECEDTCKNVYTECIKVITDGNSSGGGDPRERSYAGSPLSDPMTNTRRRKLRKRKTRKL